MDFSNSSNVSFIAVGYSSVMTEYLYLDYGTRIFTANFHRHVAQACSLARGRYHPPPLRIFSYLQKLTYPNGTIRPKVMILIETLAWFFCGGHIVAQHDIVVQPWNRHGKSRGEKNEATVCNTRCSLKLWLGVRLHLWLFVYHHTDTHT